MAERRNAIPPIDQLKGRRIGRVLTKMSKVTREQVHEALELQQKKRVPVGQLLTDLGYVTADDVNLALAAQAGMEAVDLEGLDIAKEVLGLIPAEMAQAYHVLPLAYDEKRNRIRVALKSADNFRALDDLRLLMGYEVESVVAPAKQIDEKVDKYYSDDQESIAALVAELAEDTALGAAVAAGESIDLEALVEAADDSKVKRLLNLVLLQAIKDKASDVHFEPFQDEFRMRYRIDGVLYEMVPPPAHLALPIVSRIKVMANLDIAERRKPQDGRIELQVGGKPVDLRVAVLPTMFGESVVMRVLDRSNVSLDLGKVGMVPEELDTFRQLIKKPNGIVIVTGPTGSGKTTTLYAALNELNDIETKILTAEDPVEYDVDGLVQVQVNTAVGLTFGKALRSFLRQDPDIVLVGECRDLETAKIAVEASLTGHLVFTTLHTNDAPSTFARLLDLGLEAFLVTATVEGIVAQRLVRKVCSRCKEEYTPAEDELMKLAMLPEDLGGRTIWRGRGCDYCNGSGYKGRLGVYEILVLDDEMRDLILAEASTQQIRAVARKRGVRSLREAGVRAIFDGLTTIDEVVKATMTEED